ncbi:hypothetical protein ABKV19_006793 [Rosa sericea]
MHSVKGLLNALLQLLLLQLCNSSTTNITFDQSIRDGDLLLSHDETFVLGFFSPANRDDPVNDTSGILTISTDGNLVLLHSNSQGLQLWSSNVSVSPTSNTNTMAQLLDTGNLVLVNQDTNHNNVLWQSFDHPTHVLLPNMKIGMDHGKNLYLTSWNSNNDPGTGNCTLRTEPYGSPQIILYNNHAKWWRLSERDAVFVSEMKMRFDHSVFSIIVISGSDTSASVKQLAWQGKQQGWVVVWSAPMDVCDKYGTCGPFGVCNTHTANWVKCACFPGYEPNFPQDWKLREGSGGCKKQPGAPSMCRNGEGFVRMDNVNVPDTSTVELDKNMSMEACEQKCLSNCSCLAYASADIRNGRSGCMTWYGDLMDTKQYIERRGQDFYIRADAIVAEVKEIPCQKGDVVDFGIANYCDAIHYIFCTLVFKKEDKNDL